MNHERAVEGERGFFPAVGNYQRNLYFIQVSATILPDLSTLFYFLQLSFSIANIRLFAHLSHPLAICVRKSRESVLVINTRVYWRNYRSAEKRDRAGRTKKRDEREENREGAGRNCQGFYYSRLIGNFIPLSCFVQTAEL